MPLKKRRRPQSKHVLDENAYMFLSDLKQKVIETTRELRLSIQNESKQEKEKTPSKYSERSEKLREKIVGKSFGCKTEDVISLIAAVTGEKIRPFKEENEDLEWKLPKYSMVIQLKPWDEGNAPLRVPLLVDLDENEYVSVKDHCIDSGEHVPNIGELCRVATDAEIDSYFKAFTEILEDDPEELDNDCIESLIVDWMRGFRKR
jgi:hypothetical protein